MGITALLADSEPNGIAELPISAERVHELTELADNMRELGLASVAGMQQLAGDLRSARAVVVVCVCSAGWLSSHYIAS